MRDGIEVASLVELHLVVDHPAADLLLLRPHWAPPRHLLLEEGLDLLPSGDVKEVEIGLRGLASGGGVLLPGGQEVGLW